MHVASLPHRGELYSQGLAARAPWGQGDTPEGLRPCRVSRA